MSTKKLLMTSILAGAVALSISATASAAANGAYVGGQIGLANTNYNHTTMDNSGLAGRIFGGYQFNQYFATELGYTQFSHADYKTVHFLGNTLKGHIAENAVDLVGKGILPLQDGFSLYGKAGAAYLTGEQVLTARGPDVLNGYAKHDVTEHRILPTFGVGVSYDITPNVPVDISWTRIQKVGNTDLQSTDFFGVGVSYHFG